MMTSRWANMTGQERFGVTREPVIYGNRMVTGRDERTGTPRTVSDIAQEMAVR